MILEIKMSNVNWNGILKNFPIRSWSNFFEKSSFQKPTSVEEMRKRFETNIQVKKKNSLLFFFLFLKPTIIKVFSC